MLVGAWLPEDAKKALDEQLGRPVKLPRKAIDDAVASERVREGVRQMVTETLDGFVNKAHQGDAQGSGGGSGGGLRGVLSFGARAAAGVGKGLLGGIGEELQKQLQERAKGFVDSSMAAAQKRLADRIASEETAKTLGKRRQKFFQRLMARTEPEAATWIEKSIRWKDVDALLPSVVAHNLARKELREAIEGEVQIVFDQLANEPLGALLERAGVKEHARAWAREQGLALAKGLVATDGFAQWWGYGRGRGRPPVGALSTQGWRTPLGAASKRIVMQDHSAPALLGHEHELLAAIGDHRELDGRVAEHPCDGVLANDVHPSQVPSKRSPRLTGPRVCQRARTRSIILYDAIHRWGL